jgi:hypothetical protein
MLYDNNVAMQSFEEPNEYQDYVHRASIGGSTNFVAVFNQILTLVRHKLGEKEE